MLPPQIGSLINRLEGYTTNYFRVNANGRASDYGPGRIIQFDLPTNAIINLKSFRIFFDAETTATSGAGRLPANINTLIERVEVSMGGVQISQGSNYMNVLLAAMDQISGHRAKPGTGRPVIPLFNNTYQLEGGPLNGNSQNSLVAPYNNFTMGNTSNVYSGTLTGAQTEPKIQYAFDTFLGFMDSAPMFLDTSLVPDITIRLTLAPAAVMGAFPATTLTSQGLQVAPVSTTLSYSLSNVEGFIQTVSFANSVFTQMLLDEIETEGFLEVPFKTYYNMHGSHTNATRFTVATQSLDRIWLCWRAAARSANIIMQKGSWNPAYGSETRDTTTKISELELKGVENGGYAFGSRYNVPEFNTSYFNFDAPADFSTAQLQLNGTLYPQWQADLKEWMALTDDSLEGKMDPHMIPPRYRTNSCVMVSRHNYPSSDQRITTISGIDTRAVNLQGVVNAPAASNLLDIFMECTSTLRVGPGRSVVVIP